MLKKIRFNKGDIEIGSRMQWAVYSGDGTLLLRENTVIETQRQLDAVIGKARLRGATRREAELYEKTRSIKNKGKSRSGKYFTDNVFKMKHHCAKEMENLLSCLVTSRYVDVVDVTAAIYEQISRSCELDVNAALAAVHLSKDYGYSVLHPLHTAILCKILIRRLSFNESQQRSIISAALTMNVGMHVLQETLFSQKEALTTEQKKEIIAHPEKSVALLKQAEVDDEAWLDIIHQHHERINGNGYPDKKSGKQIHPGAKVVALADIYAAMITPRLYRKPVTAQHALRDIFSKRGKEVDETLARKLIAEAGVYPPGSFVMLNNADTAIVIKRATSQGDKKIPPTVCSILDAEGRRYESFVSREAGDEKYKIVSVCQPDLTEPLDYPSLWGFA